MVVCSLFSFILLLILSLFILMLHNLRLLNSLNIPLSVETVCVFTAPVFSAFASWATYLLTKVCWYCYPFCLVSLTQTCVN